MAKRTTASTKAPEITGGQIKKIHAIKGCLGLDNDTYRALLSASFRVASSKELNYFQAEGLIQDLESKAVSAGVWEKRAEPRKYEEWGNRHGGMATPPQLRKIEAMWQGLSRAPDQDSRNKALRAFLQRVAKVSDLRFLDQEGATKVINAMNAMAKVSRKKAKPATNEDAI